LQNLTGEILRKLYLLILISACIILVVSCGESNEEKERFFKAYKEILVARETISDTASANMETAKIIMNNGFTKNEFKDMFISLSKNREEFVRVIDSLRQWATTKAAKKRSHDEE
jgi:hypothetical protein